MIYVGKALWEGGHKHTAFTNIISLCEKDSCNTTKYKRNPNISYETVALWIIVAINDSCNGHFRLIHP